MAQIQPIAAIHYAAAVGSDLSSRIAPPYDVLDATAKAALLSRDAHNIVALDLPHLPAKTVGPDSVYAQAGDTFRAWLDQGVLTRRRTPALFAYQQTYRARGQTYRRQGLMANVRIQPLGRDGAEPGAGAIYPHEQTFSAPQEDRLKLMRATAAQLSPIFGLYGDSPGGELPLAEIIDAGEPTFCGTTDHDQVRHAIWAIDQPRQVDSFVRALAGVDVFIADGHHRYSTAMMYRQALIDAGGPLPADHPAHGCLFVLVSMRDPGMIVLPTHRVLGGMAEFTFDRFVRAAQGRLDIRPFAGTDLAALERRLPSAGPHAVGFYNPAAPANPLATATCVEADPLATTHGNRSKAWRALDVAIVQHLLVEQICQPAFCPPSTAVRWKFPHTLAELKDEADASDSQLGVIMQATPLESIGPICQANELMPQKSTFFFPKLATGLIVNPLSVEL